MKTFLQNLLIFFALALCALVAYQWVIETDLRRDLQKRTDEIHDKMENIQNLHNLSACLIEKENLTGAEVDEIIAAGAPIYASKPSEQSPEQHVDNQA